MIWSLVGFLVLFWLLGLVARVGGAFVHILLICALILAFYRLLTNRH